MSVDFEWHFGPHLFEPACSLQTMCPLWLAVFVPSTATEAPITVAKIAYPTKTTGHSRLEVETAQVECFWTILSPHRCGGKLTSESEISFMYSVKFDLKSDPCFGVFAVDLCASCAALCEHA